MNILLGFIEHNRVVYRPKFDTITIYGRGGARAAAKRAKNGSFRPTNTELLVSPPTFQIHGPRSGRKNETLYGW